YLLFVILNCTGNSGMTHVFALSFLDPVYKPPSRRAQGVPYGTFPCQFGSVQLLRYASAAALSTLRPPSAGIILAFGTVFHVASSVSVHCSVAVALKIQSPVSATTDCSVLILLASSRSMRVWIT